MKRRSYKGKNNPFFGKHHNEKIKIKIKNSVYHKNLKGKNNPNFGNHKLKGHKLTKIQCKKISNYRRKNQFGKNNPFYGKKHKINLICNHHLYLFPNTKIIKITANKHRQFHARAYDYLCKVYGTQAIDNYLKWFINKYSMKIYGKN